MKEIREIFVDYICNYIVPRKLYTKSFGMGFSRGTLLSIKYNHRFYNLDIIQIEDKLYWKLTPYVKECYITIIDDYSSFDRVLFAIMENDKAVNNSR